MKLSDALRLIPAERLSNGLRVNEESVLDEVRGDIHSLQVAYRIICRRLKGINPTPLGPPYEFIKFADLPDELKKTDTRQQTLFRFLKSGNVATRKCHQLDSKQFAAIRERIEALVKEAGEQYLSLKPYDQMEMFTEPDSPCWREERIRFYERQNRALERRFNLAPDPSCRKGPRKRPVQCFDIDGAVIQRFDSTRHAAEWMRTDRGTYIRRSDLRTAIRKAHRCGGLRWTYIETKRQRKASVDDQLPLFAEVA